MSFDTFISHLKSVPALSVKVTCSCKETRPVDELYFCSQQGCKQLVCDRCCLPVIDTYFCPACLNSFFSSSAFQAKNRCLQCLQCPRCPHTLSPVSKAGVCLFRCSHCLWMSDKLGLAGADVAALYAVLSEHNINTCGQTEFDKLVSHYSNKVKQQAADKEVTEDKLDGLPDKNGMVNVAAAAQQLDTRLEQKNRELWVLPDGVVDNSLAQSGGLATAAAAAVQGGAPLASLQQRHRHGYTATADTAAAAGADGGNTAVCAAAPSEDQLWPLGVPLLTKMGYKCPHCTKFVMKPKAGATKVTFDVQELAISAIPTTTVQLPDGGLKAGQANRVLVYFHNQQEAEIELSFLSVPDMLAVDLSSPHTQTNNDDENSSSSSSSSSSSGDACLPAAVMITEDTALAMFPQVPVAVGGFDDVAENDLAVSTESKLSDTDDDKVVAFRRLSKVGVFVEVNPTTANQDCTFSVGVLVKAGKHADSAAAADRGGAEEGDGSAAAAATAVSPSASTSPPPPFSSFTYQLHFNLGPSSS